MSRIHVLIPLSLAAAGAIASAGCGNTSNAQTPPTTTTKAAAPAAAPTTTAAPSATPSAGPVKVTLSDFKITPSTTAVKAGKVTFDVKNTGKTPHEMVVIKTTKESGAMGSAGAARVSEDGSVGEVSDLKAGAGQSKTFDLKPGHYALVCNIPGHWAMGMHADLTVS